jgi:ribonuclease VapC
VIAVDTSALMAIVNDEPAAEFVLGALSSGAELVISAATVAEALVVAGRRNRALEMERLIDGLNFEVVPVTLASARRVVEAYGRWGRGVHAAGLNFGDCFAYEVATVRACPLLFVGDDFSRTDVAVAL